MSDESLAYAASRTAALPLPSQPYEGDEATGLLLLISHAAPFKPAEQTALRLIYGLDDARRWPVTKAIEAAKTYEWDVRRAKQGIDARLVAWRVANGSRSGLGGS